MTHARRRPVHQSAWRQALCLTDLQSGGKHDRVRVMDAGHGEHSRVYSQRLQNLSPRLCSAHPPTRGLLHPPLCMAPHFVLDLQSGEQSARSREGQVEGCQAHLRVRCWPSSETVTLIQRLLSATCHGSDTAVCSFAQCSAVTAVPHLSAPCRRDPCLHQ